MKTKKHFKYVSLALVVLIMLVPAGGLTQAQEPEPPEEPDDLVMNFDGDIYADLAIGVPYANIGSDTDAGAVSVVYGASTGLTGTADEYWRQDALTGSNSETYEYFGRALAVGDFDGDGYYDLAVGVSHEDVVSVAQAGAVNVIYGAANGGLSSIGNEYWNQDITGMVGVAETNDHFGWALAAGDFDGDGYDDLAIGVPDEDIGTVVDAGCVQVMYGTASGLTAANDEIWDQGGGAETADRMGRAVAAGDFDNDGYDDLAVGIPYEDLGGTGNAGVAQIYYGSSGGLFKRPVVNDLWHQDRTGVADTADANDYFGLALTVGDFDGDSYADLAVGVPYEDVGSGPIVNGGAVNVLYGSSSGIASAGSDYWHQDSAGIGNTAEDYDIFGWALTAGDFDGDGYADLAVGVPYEGWTASDTGIVQVLYGAAGGLSTRDQLWRQDTAGIQGGEEADDRFGYAVAAGDFDGDDYADLAVGVPYESIGTADNAGAVHVIYGSTTGLTATGDQLWYRGNNGLSGTPVAGDQFGRALAAIPMIAYEIYLPLVLKSH